MITVYPIAMYAFDFERWNVYDTHIICRDIEIAISVCFTLVCLEYPLCICVNLFLIDSC